VRGATSGRCERPRALGGRFARKVKDSWSTGGLDRPSTHYWFVPALQTGFCNDPAGVHSVDQGLVVALVLVGVGTGEVGDGPVEDIAVA
jgi:hypothetical protein